MTWSNGAEPTHFITPLLSDFEGSNEGVKPKPRTTFLNLVGLAITIEITPGFKSCDHFASECAERSTGGLYVGAY